MAMALLSIKDLQVRYGGTLGTRRVSFDIERGETIALVGSNGSGKSSTLKAIMGLAANVTGEIAWEGRSIVGRRPSEIVRLGIGLSPEGRRVFPMLSVVENLRMGAFTRSRHEQAERLEQMLDVFPRLRERSLQRASSLSGGEQQMLAIGRALMSRPRLFLLDEPSLGLAPIIVTKIGEALLDIQRREDLSFVLAEQNADWAMQVAERAVILELGTCVMDGASADLRRDPRVQAAYLGI
jgi:branched-chain amino acid transport system ATP-binding protein